MGRGRVQLRRIENKINRQVTFSKRRCGLLKKANEISILCDAEVALVIFSTKGKLYEYSTDSSMEKIIERYERFCYAGKELGSGNSELEGCWSLEYLKLKSKVESLQKGERNLMGNDLDSLNPKELHNLEQQLESGLKKIKAQKNNLLCDSIMELQTKEKALRQQNHALEKKLKIEKTASAQRAQPHQQNPKASYSSSIPLFGRVEPLPNLNLGYLL